MFKWCCNCELSNITRERSLRWHRERRCSVAFISGWEEGIKPGSGPVSKIQSDASFQVLGKDVETDERMMMVMMLATWSPNNKQIEQSHCWWCPFNTISRRSYMGGENTTTDGAIDLLLFLLLLLLLLFLPLTVTTRLENPKRGNKHNEITVNVSYVYTFLPQLLDSSLQLRHPSLALIARRNSPIP